jgi:uncharacterized delta-60 repeat protein
MNTKAGLLNALIGASLLAASVAAHAQFDANGVSYEVPDQVGNSSFASALALIPGGGFYVSGTTSNTQNPDLKIFHVRRFNDDASRDSSFDIDLVHSGSLNTRQRGLLAHPDGGVVVAYTLANAQSPTDSYSYVRRYDSTGAPVSSVFSFDNSAGYDSLEALAMQNDGKILAAGSTAGTLTSGYQAIVARLNANGSVDTSFGVDGYVRVSSPISSTTFAQRGYEELSFRSVNVLEDGRIFLAGTAAQFSGNSEMLFMRLMPDGSPDPDFNNGEPLLYAIMNGNSASSFSSVGSADVAQDGSFLIGGRGAFSTDYAYLLLFHPDGSLIVQQREDFGTVDRINDVQLLPNGGVIAVGNYYDGSGGGSIARFTTGLSFNGSIEPRFDSSALDHSLTATAYDPAGQRMVSVGSGITTVSGVAAYRWVMTTDAVGGDQDAHPDPFSFAEQPGVQPGDSIESELVQINGFDNGVRVPVRLFNGEATVDGTDLSDPFTTPPFYGVLKYFTASGNPAVLNAQLRHTAADGAATTDRITALMVGGVVRSNNLPLTLGATELGKLKSSTAGNGSSAGEIRFTIRDDQEIEGTRATLAVQRVGGSSGAVTLGYSIINNSTGSGTAETLEWADGETAEKFINLDTIDDDIAQGTRVYEVYLDGVTGGATLDSNRLGTITILDNDTAPTPTPAQTPVPTPVPTATPAPTATPTAVPTATPSPTTTPLPSPTATPAPTQDPRPGSVRISEIDSSVREGQTARYTVRRVGGSNGAVSVRYAITAGSAIPLSDYENSSGTLSWADGETDQRSITVRTFDNAVTDGARTFQLVLSDATGGLALGSPANATTTITDNDIAPEPVTHVDLTLGNGEIVSITTAAGSIDNARTAPTPAGLPAGFDYPMEFIAFDITGVEAGATVEVTLQLPEGIAPDAYVKCANASCELFADASIEGDQVTLSLTDGGAGDADGLANGVIADPGAPAVALDAPPPEQRRNGGALNGLMLALLALPALLRRRRAVA